MVVLVRLIDDTVTVALEANLGRLIKDGLIKSFLSSGDWIETVNRQCDRKQRTTPLSDPRHTAYVSCF
ncbi:GSU3473 family protein [Geobacter pickeringii]|uniref:Uncharacterized protein n=1 Tax=Geobacter pickeringii TaxID=345632 RepID=A0A0B5B8Z5_9BACT|nr:hypothetical protein [Geobacter pickeringii]AJE03193.1 hypothetical protein GPICK_07340 [Geobacter pickeringii]